MQCTKIRAFKSS